jgi:hypothetical protein
VSNEVSVRAAAVNVVSNLLSVAIVSIAAVSNAVSVEAAARAAADNTISNAVSVVSQALSSQAAALSVRVDTQSQSISVLSQRISAASAVNAIGVSVEGLQSALGALSDRISVASRVDFFPTTPILDDFNRANEGPPPSANWGTIVGTGHKVLSNQMVPDSNANHTSWWTAQTFGPDIEVYLTVVTKSGNGFNVDIGWIDASVNGYEVIIKSEAGVDTLTTYRLDAGVGTQLGIVGREITNGDRYGFRSLSGVHTVLVSPNGSAMWYELASYTDTTHSVTTARLIVATKDGTAVCDNFGGGNCLTTINAASAVSQALSVLSQANSVAHAALSARIDATSNTVSALIVIIGNVASVQSQGFSVLNAYDSNLTSAINVVSNAASNALSVANAASNAASIVSNALSVQAALLSNLTSAHNVLSNRVSANSGTGGAASVTSDELSVLLNSYSARSAGVSTRGLQSILNTLSNRISAAGGGAGSVTSTELSAVSAQAASAINIVSNAVSAIGMQQRSRSNQTSVISGSGLVDIAGMSASLAASAGYIVKGAIMWEKTAVSGGMAFVISLPSLGAAGSYIRMQTQSAANSEVQTGAGIPVGGGAFSAVAAGTRVTASVSAATLNVIRWMEITGFLNTSAAGTMQLMARTSAAAQDVTIRGGYLRLYRVN